MDESNLSIEERNIVNTVVQEIEAKNPNYYTLFGAQAPQSLEPLTEEDKKSLSKTAHEYIAIIKKASPDENVTARCTKCKLVNLCFLIIMINLS
jgi:hypothetical protein